MSPGVAIASGMAILAVVIALTLMPPDRLAFVLVGALVLVITWNGLRATGGAAANILLVLASIAVIAHAVVDRERVPIPTWLLLCAAGFIVAAFLVQMFPPSLGIQNRTTLQFNQMFLTADVPITVVGGNRSNVAALIKWEIALVIIPVLVAVAGSTPWRINRLLDLWTIGALINAFVGIADYSGFHTLAAEPLAGNRSAGLTLQPNYLALTACLALPTALRWAGRSRRGTQAALLATLILIGGEYTTGSRDGNVSFAVTLVLCFVFMPRLRPMLRYVLPAAVGALVLLLTLTHLGSQILNQVRLGGPVQNTIGSDNERAFFRHVAEAQISARPLTGIGFAVDNDAQNIYLQILASGGIIAMASFLAFIAGLAGCVRRSLRGPVREDAIAVGICIASWLINGYYDAQVADKYLYVLPGILMACARVSMRARAESAQAARLDFPVAVTAPQALAPVGAAQ